MMQTLPLSIFFLTLPFASLPAPAQDAPPPAVNPDPLNVAARALPGKWTMDRELSQRLGGSKGPASLEFKVDPTVLNHPDSPIPEQLSSSRIYLAGAIMVDKQKRHFALTGDAGNSSIVEFGPGKDGSKASPRSWTVAIAQGADSGRDILFLKLTGSEALTVAFTRQRPAILTPRAALTKMVGTLESGDSAAFFSTYFLPEDLARITKRGQTIAEIAEVFNKRKRDSALDFMRRALKVAPKLSEDGNLATWEIEEAPGDLVLHRIDGRWYMEN